VTGNTNGSTRCRPVVAYTVMMVERLLDCPLCFATTQSVSVRSGSEFFPAFAEQKRFK